MKLLDALVFRISVRMLRWRFPACTVIVSSASEPFFDARLGEERMTVRNYTRVYIRGNAGIARKNLEAVADARDHLADKLTVADLFNEIESTNETSKT